MYTATLKELKVNIDLQTLIDHLNKEEEKKCRPGNNINDKKWKRILSSHPESDTKNEKITEDTQSISCKCKKINAGRVQFVKELHKMGIIYANRIGKATVYQYS